MRIYYLTRTYPGRKNGGGGTSRQGIINSLRKYGYDVWIVSPNYRGNKVDINDTLKHVLLPHVGYHKLCTVLEYSGFWDDYLEGWAVHAVKYLENVIHKEDILFATSGGELGCIILGNLLKERIGCKFVINFHDPLNFTTAYDGLIRFSKRKIPHVLRDKPEEQNLKIADAIIASSRSYQCVLVKKYPYMRDKIFYNYFGYTEKISYIKYEEKISPINIVYGGAMGLQQSPEILAEAAKGLNDIKITYIGNWMSNQNLKQYRNERYVELMNPMSFEEYSNYLLKYADIGFVSLQGKAAKLCVPHKLYELINFSVPILAVIEGDARKIIEKNEYGVVSEYTISSLQESIIKITNKENYLKYKQNIINDRNKWSMENQIKGIVKILENLKYSNN
jgi:glycosyltransferase involved in cell wall biosynthesis